MNHFPEATSFTKVLMVAAGCASLGLGYGASRGDAALWLDGASPFLFYVSALAWFVAAWRPWTIRLGQWGAVAASLAPFYRLVVTVLDVSRDSTTSTVNAALRASTWAFVTTVVLIVWTQFILPLAVFTEGDAAARPIRTGSP